MMKVTSLSSRLSDSVQPQRLQPIMVVKDPPSKLAETFSQGQRVEGNVVEASTGPNRGDHIEAIVKIMDVPLRVESDIPLPEGAHLKLQVHRQGDTLSLLIHGLQRGNLPEETHTFFSEASDISIEAIQLPNDDSLPDNKEHIKAVQLVSVSALSVSPTKADQVLLSSSPASYVFGGGTATDRIIYGYGTNSHQVSSYLLSEERFSVRLPEMDTTPHGLSGEKTKETVSPDTSSVAAGLSPTETVSGEKIAGFISKITGKNQPIFQAEDGRLFLLDSPPIKLGTSLTMEIEDKLVSPGREGDQNVSADQGLKEFIMSPYWQGMTELLAIARQGGQDITGIMTTGKIPRLNGQLGAYILLFLGALKTGNTESFFGQKTINMLREKRPHLLDRLFKELKLAIDTAAQKVTEDWRVMVIPLFNNQHVEKIRLLTRKDRDEHEGDTPKGEAIRFIMDVTFSHLGLIQIDGLVNRQKKRMDFILRTSSPLPAHANREVMRIFEDGTALTGMQGRLSFRSDPPDFTDVGSIIGKQHTLEMSI